MKDEMEARCVLDPDDRIVVRTANRGQASVTIVVDDEDRTEVVLGLAGGRAVVQALARILGPEVLEPEPEPGERYFRAKAKALGVPGSGRADWSNLIDQAKSEHAMVEAALIAQGWAP
jgi:hypothetical protein